MRLLAKWHLRAAREYASAAEYADRETSDAIDTWVYAHERPEDVAVSALDASAAWVKAIEHLLYAVEVSR